MKQQAKILSEANELARLMISHYLQKHDVNLNQFSKHINVPQPTLFKFMKGWRTLSSRNIEKVGEFFSK
jgi:predicted transcriptional regulator